ncbi:hypothetical protein BsWGS_18405 [Bradybaena similaris]
MKLLFAVVAVVISTCVQHASADTILFEAKPTTVHPVLTKSLKLRCALQNEFNTNVAFRQRAITAAATPTTRSTPTTAHATTPTAAHTTPTIAHATAPTIAHATAPTTAHATAPTAHASSTHPSFIETTSSHSSTSNRPLVPHADVSHIMSILVSRQDRVTGRLQTVAEVSPYDPASTSVDADNIKVEGDTEASPVSREKGYLEVTWEDPTEAQSGEYVCNIYGLDKTLHPVSLSSSARITAIQATTQDLAAFVVQNQRHVTELQQSLANVTAQMSKLQKESQEQIQAFSYSIDSLQNTTKHMKAQNIQTGTVACATVQVTFPRPYERDPTVFVSILKFQDLNANDNWNLAVTVNSRPPSCFKPTQRSSTPF